MARILARTLTLARPAPTSLRGLATKVEVIEIDLSEEDAAAAPSSKSNYASSKVDDIARIRRLHDAIHGLLVRRNAPDWLPFVPGSSFWVPPARAPRGIGEVMDRINEAGRVGGAVGGGAVEMVQLDVAMAEEGTISFFPNSGWPCATYFVKGKFPRPRKKTWETDDEES